MSLEAYLDRIAYDGAVQADLPTLRELHRLHPQHIPFENLSTLLGEPVSLDPDALDSKLVRQRRGGYCFEQNGLFLRMLRAIGFQVLPLAARVVWNRKDGATNPRTHMALLVEIGDRRYLSDVGFGGVTLTGPLEFETGVEQTTPHETFRIDRTDRGFALFVRFGEQWRPVYEFDLQAQEPVDYEAMNHYVQTWPGSVFRSVLMAGRPDTKGRYALAGNRLSRYEQGSLTEQRTLDSAAALRSALENEFGLALPDSQGLDALLTRIAASGPA